LYRRRRPSYLIGWMGQASTNLPDNFQERLGMRTPLTIVTTRMLLLYGVAMRRESQVIGSRVNLGYPSLRDYQYAANESLSLSDRLDQTADRSSRDCQYRSRRRRKNRTMTLSHNFLNAYPLPHSMQREMPQCYPSRIACLQDETGASAHIQDPKH
jgi:hypothetical protein